MTKAKAFLALHHQNKPFILPNAWNAGSARMMEMAGFKAIATTSAGIAFSHGLADGSNIDPEIMFEELIKIVKAVSVPVTTDIETGYGDIKGTIKRVMEIGAVGANIEDAIGEELDSLFDIERAVENIRAAKEASGPDFVLNARTDTYLTGQPDALKQSIERGNRFVEAGADCVFVPGVVDRDEIKTLVTEIDGPINILGGVSDQPLSLSDFAELGVNRISTGGSLARRTFAALNEALYGLADQGSFDYATQAIADGAMNKMFRG